MIELTPNPGLTRPGWDSSRYASATWYLKMRNIHKPDLRVIVLFNCDIKKKRMYKEKEYSQSL